ncbi:MAG: PIN domain-containing protein [Oscillospiraceae bacterium]|nr:PIN domain-containing protein [Oscillospiraceae bacterium]
MDYVFDSNTIIHLMRGTKSIESKVDEARKSNARFIIPYTVHYEITRGLLIKQIPKHIKVYDIICSNCSVESITDEVWDKAAEIYADLYKKRFTVADADILIAAFCIINRYTLVTDNTNDFLNISKLNYINWL